jgi:hypothetical protein
MKTERFKSFREFYPYYLTEHRLAGTRIMHFIGTTGFLFFVASAFLRSDAWLVLYGVIFAYGFAWISHFFIEKNKPATFQYPLWSLMSDFKLYFELIIRKEKFSS